jgi:ketosteroid isomerase-like protein
MTTQEIAARFDELAKTAQWDQILDELYADDAESIEPASAEGPLQSVKGKEAMKKKGEAFNAQMQEFHSAHTTPAVVGGNHFSVAMGMDVTLKDAGRVNMEEICVYKVENGKIVLEQFFY